MPPLSVQTGLPPKERTPSPVRPPVSPITPPLPATVLPGDNRPTFTHTTQAEQVGIPPPAPEPIDFESNPDVIALKSAISVLQVQRGRATADIQALSKIKDEASREPEAFLRDLAAGGVRSRDDALTLDDDEDEDEEMEGNAGKAQTKEAPRSWSSLPKPQNVVRCPPINWSQYAVVGDSLDKLHADQISHPPQGVPATLGSNGTYEFKAGEEKPEKYSGVAAPYDPLKDKVDRKAKSRN